MDPRISKTGVILIHGIGDQRQRMLLRDFHQSLTRLQLAGPNEQQTFRDVNIGNDQFSFVTAQSEVAQRPLALAEFHWSDLSPVRSGFLSTLRNYTQLVIDAPDIIYSCLGPSLVDGRMQDSKAMALLRVVVATAVWLIYFPIVAVNAAYAILVGGFALHRGSSSGVISESLASNTIGLTAVVACLAILILLCRHGPSTYFRVVAWWTIAVLLAAVAFVGLGELRGWPPPTFKSMAEIFNDALNGLWALVLLLGWVYMAGAMYLYLRHRSLWRPGVMLGFAVLFIVSRLWLVLITTLWLIFLTLSFDPTTFQQLIADIGGPIRFISLLWLELAIVFAALGISFLVHLVLTHAERRKSGPAAMTGILYPRLVVPESVPLLAVALSFLTVISGITCSCVFSRTACELTRCNLIGNSSEAIIANAALFLIGGGLLVQIARGGFKLALDIVNYFRVRIGHHQANPFQAVATAYRFKAITDQTLRSRMQSRLDAMTESFVENEGPFDRVVIVSHSLGTMLAIEALQRWHREGNNSHVVDLVTMGSPYSAIFQHYFPHMFEQASMRLLPGVSSWTNIYRSNDYVGAALTNGEAGIAEVRQRPLGHADYLRDDDVIREIIERAIRLKTPT